MYVSVPNAQIFWTRLSKCKKAKFISKNNNKEQKKLFHNSSIELYQSCSLFYFYFREMLFFNPFVISSSTPLLSFIILEPIIHFSK